MSVISSQEFSITGAGTLEPGHQRGEDGGSAMDSDQMFRLIDSILPFEGCLYYQILPIALEGSSLKLGMVNPKDADALDYAKRILAYLNCSLKPQPIAADFHQSMLSAYLNYTNTLKLSRRQPIEEHSAVYPNEQPTLIVDSPPSLNYQEEQAREEGQEEPPLREEKTSDPTSPSTGEPASRPSLLPVLKVQAHHLSRPIEFLATLPPPQLLQELLGRVIIEGIGRLYFERQQAQGRILWSQDGVLQSVLKDITLPVFQGVINELKMMANLPLIPVEQPKQVEIERYHQQNRLLLCLRVMPGQYGEEATLQVLRGAALKFYQQQQVARLSRDALSLAQQLQLKLKEIRERTKLNPTVLDALPALDQMLESLHQQVEAIKKEVPNK